MPACKIALPTNPPTLQSTNAQPIRQVHTPEFLFSCLYGCLSTVCTLFSFIPLSPFPFNSLFLFSTLSSFFSFLFLFNLVTFTRPFLTFSSSSPLPSSFPPYFSLSLSYSPASYSTRPPSPIHTSAPHPHATLSMPRPC